MGSSGYACAADIGADLGIQATEVGAPPGGNTQDSWGRTGHAPGRPRAARSRSLAALGAGAAGAVALVAWGVSRTTATATPGDLPAVAPTRAPEAAVTLTA